MARLVISQITETSFSAYITELDTSYSRDDRFIDWCLNGNLNPYTTTTLAPYVYESDVVAFSYLESGATYTIEAKIYYTNGGLYETVTLTGSCTTLVKTRPGYFSWTYPKIKGNDFLLMYWEWNDLTTNINAVRQYKGFPSFYFTSARSGNELKAYMYNECLYAMEPMYPSWNLAASEVSSGDDVTAASLNYLVTLVNGI